MPTNDELMLHLAARVNGARAQASAAVKTVKVNGASLAPTDGVVDLGTVGTSSLTLGTTASTAKAGNYQPTAANITDATATGRSLLTAADAAGARTAIGAGTSSLALGTTSSTAKAGNYSPSTAEVTAAGAITGVKKNGATQAVTSGVVDLGTVGTSNLALGTTSTTAKAGDYQPTAANITDATTTGRAILKAPAGTAGQVLSTNGDGTIAWVTAPTGGTGSTGTATEVDTYYQTGA